MFIFSKLVMDMGSVTQVDIELVFVVGQTVLFGFAQVRLFVLCRGWPGNRAPELLFFRYGQKGLCGLRNGPGLVFA